MKPTKKQITKKTIFREILEDNPDSAEVLMNAGLHCFGCPMSQMETLEQGCLAHGLNKKQIEELIKKLNEVKKEK